MAEHKLDIFRTLAAIDRKSSQFYSSLDESEQKAYQPLVVLKWAVGTTDNLQIVQLNECVNRYVFPLAQHKDLLWKLSVVGSTNKKHKYQWNKSLPEIKASEAIHVVCEYFQYNERDAKQVLPLLSTEDIIDIATGLGYTTENIAKIKKELKCREV